MNKVCFNLTAVLQPVPGVKIVARERKIGRKRKERGEAGERAERTSSPLESSLAPTLAPRAPLFAASHNQNAWKRLYLGGDSFS